MWRWTDCYRKNNYGNLDAGEDRCLRTVPPDRWNHFGGCFATCKRRSQSCRKLSNHSDCGLPHPFIFSLLPFRIGVARFMLCCAVLCCAVLCSDVRVTIIFLVNSLSLFPSQPPLNKSRLQVYLLPWRKQIMLHTRGNSASRCPLESRPQLLTIGLRNGQNRHRNGLVPTAFLSFSSSHTTHFWY